MSLFRWILGLPAAGIITAALFFMMAELIKDNGLELSSSKQIPDLSITAEEPDEKGWEKPPKPKPLPDSTPETEFEFTKPIGPPDSVGIDTGPGTIETTTPDQKGMFSGGTIKITPAYPEGCRSKGAEGVVVVEFDITPEGNVVNPRILQSPDRCFNRPIRSAVSKWKFPPAPSNGSNTRRTMTESFNFQLVE
ncbi:energy transducer TonB [Hyphococcus flavus]|uniref:Energy transducer TonB n=1 Tax=Hyphococcus flavus TaxID=1866326 RepID=A0AAF0CF49_9PROT|nr:energy transducer TonB [Hyphococcus flavus]WDI30478.1 energy transducer TonB [Hyphococcus flavus]